MVLVMSRGRVRTAMVALSMSVAGCSSAGTGVSQPGLNGGSTTLGPGGASTEPGATPSGSPRTAPGASASTSAGAQGPGVGPADSSGGFTGPGTNPGGGGGPSTVASGVGITATSVKIGFILPAGNPGQAFGVSGTTGTDLTAQQVAQAFVDDLNSRGGLAGRKVQPVFVTNDNTDNSQSNQTNVQNNNCTTLAEDQKVFAAVALNVGGTSYGAPCYAQHHTPLFDRELQSYDAETVAKLSPYFFAPISMNLTRMAELFPGALREESFLTKHMAVIAYDLPATRSLTEKVLIPGIKAEGGLVTDKVFTKVDYGDLGSQTANAVLTFRQHNVDRVVFFAPGGGAPLLFSKQADSQGYYPRLGVSTLDCPGPCMTPGNGLNVPAKSVQGAVGFGYTPAYDTGGFDPYAKPTALMSACWAAANKRLGTHMPKDGGSAIDFALRVCDMTNFLRQALEPATGKTLLQDNVGGLVEGLGTSFQSVWVKGTNFGPSRHDGASRYALLGFVSDCGDGNGCWRYSSSFRQSPV